MTLALLSAALLLPACPAEAAIGAAVTVRVSRPSASPFGPFRPGGEVLIAEQRGVVIDGPGASPTILTTFRAAAFAPTFHQGPSVSPLGGDIRAVARLGDGRSHPVAVVAADPRSGLAAFRFLADAPEVAPLAVATGGEPRPGDAVCTVTPPRDGLPGPAVVRRVVAAAGRSFAGAAAGGAAAWSGDDPGPGTLHAFGTLTALDPPPPPGSSGGAVLNQAGELIGLLFEPPEGDALPPRMLPLTGSFRRVVESLSRGERIGYGLLGVEPADVTADAAVATLGATAPPGAALLEEVRGDSPAERTGLRRGEWVVGFAGPDGDAEPVRSAADLVRLVALAPPGSEVRLEVLAPFSGARRTAPVALVAAATDRAAGGWPAVVTAPAGAAVRGVRVDWPTAAFLPPPGEPLPTGVSIVAAVVPPNGDRAPRVGDRVVSVNGRAVFAPAEFAAAVAARPGPVVLTLLDGSERTLPPDPASPVDRP